MQPHIQRMRQHIQRMQSPHTTNATIHTTNATRRQQMQLGRQRMQPRRQQPSCFVRAKNSFCFELPLTVLSVLVHCIRIVDHFVLLVDWPLLTLEEQFQLSCGEIKMSHAISLSLDFDVLLSHLRLTFFHFQNISYASQVVSPSIPPRFSSVSRTVNVPMLRTHFRKALFQEIELYFAKHDYCCNNLQLSTCY